MRILTLGDVFGEEAAKYLSEKLFNYINTNNITSAYYKAYEFSGNNQRGYIQAYDSWFNTSIGNITYDMCHEAVTDYYPVGEVFVATSCNWVNIPITDLVISWIDAELSPSYIFSEEFGFILHFTHNSPKRFSPPGSSGNPPSIIINYTQCNIFIMASLLEPSRTVRL